MSLRLLELSPTQWRGGERQMTRRAAAAHSPSLQGRDLSFFLGREIFFKIAFDLRLQVLNHSDSSARVLGALTQMVLPTPASVTTALSVGCHCAHTAACTDLELPLSKASHLDLESPAAPTSNWVTLSLKADSWENYYPAWAISLSYPRPWWRSGSRACLLIKRSLVRDLRLIQAAPSRCDLGT